MARVPIVGLRARTISGVSALLVFFIVLLGPVFVFRIVAGIPMDAPGPSGEIWLLIISGGLAAGAGRFVHGYLMLRVFGASEEEEQKDWGRHP
jgi:hypothetical protein